MAHEKTIYYWKVVVSLIFSLLATFLVIYIGIRGVLFFMPFAVGWVISLIALPMVKWLEKRLKIKRKIGSAIIIVLVLALIVLIGYLVMMLVWDLGISLINDFPLYYESLKDEIQLASDNITMIVSGMPEIVGDGWNTIKDNFSEYISELITIISQPTVSAAGSVAKKVPSFLVSFIVMIIAAYFFISDREQVILWCKKIAPKPIQKRMDLVAYQLKYALGGYFKAQFKIMLVICFILAVCLSVLKVEYAILIAIVTGMLDFLPIFGTGAVLWPWAIFEILIGDYKRAIILFVIYLVTQGIRQLIQPKFVADSIGLAPLPTLVLLYVGYQLGGVLGMIIAIPTGLIIINLYEAGAFDYILDDVKILVEGILNLRKR